MNNDGFGADINFTCRQCGKLINPDNFYYLNLRKVRAYYEVNNATLPVIKATKNSDICYICNDCGNEMGQKLFETEETNEDHN